MPRWAVDTLGWNRCSHGPSIPDGTISQIIDSTGDGGGNSLAIPTLIAVDGSGDVFVTGQASDNVFKITPEGTITQIIDAAGDGAGNSLDRPVGIALDNFGDIYVAGGDSHNAFKIVNFLFKNSLENLSTAPDVVTLNLLIETRPESIIDTPYN